MSSMRFASARACSTGTSQPRSTHWPGVRTPARLTGVVRTHQHRRSHAVDLLGLQAELRSVLAQPAAVLAGLLARHPGRSASARSCARCQTPPGHRRRRSAHRWPSRPTGPGVPGSSFWVICCTCISLAARSRSRGCSSRIDRVAAQILVMRGLEPGHLHQGVLRAQPGAVLGGERRRGRRAPRRASPS